MCFFLFGDEVLVVVVCGGGEAEDACGDDVVVDAVAVVLSWVFSETSSEESFFAWRVL